MTARGMCRKHYLSAWRAGTLAETPTLERAIRECPEDHPHDLATCWAEHGCRCKQRRHLRRMERQRRRVRLRAYGREDQITPPRVPALPIRDHVAWLRGEGFGLERIADAAQVSRSVMMTVYYGPRGNQTGERDITKRTVRESLAERIHATTPDQIEAAYVPSNGTVRR